MMTDSHVAPLRLVVALGGNAILPRGDDGTIGMQYQRSNEAAVHLARLAGEGHLMVVTHGNGPVVGNIVLRNEAARAQIPPMPLYIAGADSEGGIGLMIQMTLGNAVDDVPIDREVLTIVTQVVVDRDDPAFLHPTKPIGPYYDVEALKDLRAKEPMWEFVEVPGCGWRRVVPSPRPKRIVEAGPIRRLMEFGDIVIAAGGGGVPVIEGPARHLTGIDAVIDKDWASALLAAEIEADVLVILMESDRVYKAWGTPEQHAIDRLTPNGARALVASGALEAGSISPKVAASAWFASETGKRAVICRVDDLQAALAGEAGTQIAP
ncbi:MAG TPA: carbamate kinase [Coriobacteriia bacterium]